MALTPTLVFPLLWNHGTFLALAASVRWPQHTTVHPLSTETRLSEVKSSRSLFQFLLGFPKRTQCGCTIIHLPQTHVEYADFAGAWPRPRPEWADPWEPRPIRADSDVSFDQGRTPLREVDGLRRDPLRHAFVGVQSKGSVQFSSAFAGVFVGVLLES